MRQEWWPISWAAFATAALLRAALEGEAGVEPGRLIPRSFRTQKRPGPSLELARDRGVGRGHARAMKPGLGCRKSKVKADDVARHDFSV